MSLLDATIIGAGSWGRSLAHILLNNNKKILIYSRNKIQLDISYSADNIIKTNNFNDVCSNQNPIIIATPVNSLREIGEMLNKGNFNGPIILACKGLESSTGLFPSEILANYFLIDKIAVITGPSFASEVIKNKPTAVTIAGIKDDVINTFSRLFHSKLFRVYESNDLIGCQLGGAMKNILSVAVGISDGLQLGPNAKAALISRGIYEIKILSEKLNCDDKTIYGLSGLGDLVLTANDNLSRNRRFGIEVSQGVSIDEAEKKIGYIVEGISAAKGLQILIKKYSLILPICTKVFDIIDGKISPKEAVNDLLSRDQKKEFV